MHGTGYEKYTYGMALLEDNKHEEALFAFLESLAINQHFKTCERIADVLEDLGRTVEAESYVIRAFQLNRSNSKVATRYAQILFSRGERQEASRVTQDVLAENPTYGPAKRLHQKLNL